MKSRWLTILLALAVAVGVSSCTGIAIDTLNGSYGTVTMVKDTIHYYDGNGTMERIECRHLKILCDNGYTVYYRTGDRYGFTITPVEE